MIYIGLQPKFIVGTLSSTNATLKRVCLKRHLSSSTSNPPVVDFQPSANVGVYAMENMSNVYFDYANQSTPGSGAQVITAGNEIVGDTIYIVPSINVSKTTTINKCDFYSANAVSFTQFGILSPNRSEILNIGASQGWNTAVLEVITITRVPTSMGSSTSSPGRPVLLGMGTDTIYAEGTAPYIIYSDTYYKYRIGYLKYTIPNTNYYYKIGVNARVANTTTSSGRCVLMSVYAGIRGYKA